MDAEVLREIEWTEYGETVLHPLALLLTLLMVAWLLTTSKARVIVPMLVVGLFITSMQRLVIGSFDFTMIRLIFIVGVARAVIRNDIDRIDPNRMDSLFVAYVMIASVTYIALWGNTNAIVNRLGFAFEALLAFFLVRLYITSSMQITALVRALAVVSVATAIFMFIEQQTGYNTFSIFGGVSPITPMREGRLRAQGAFSHAIMAGTFGATFFPLFWGLWWTERHRDRQLAIVGGVSAVAITWFSSSSGPVLSLLASIFAVGMWHFRQYTRLLRWSFVGVLILLDIVMQAPVWHLISRVDIVGGSTGYHRYVLIDNAIRRFPEWAAFGVRTTGHWGWGLNDVTNHYILQAVNGGMLTLLAFLLVIRSGFRSVGVAVAQGDSSEANQKMHWAWGCVLFSHCVSFFGVSYFGQLNFFWFLTLGIIAGLPSLVTERSPATSLRLGNFSSADH